MLAPVFQHRWDLSPKEAIALQRELFARVRRTALTGPVTSVAGIDVGIKGGVARAAVVVLSMPDLRVMEEATGELPVPFPYVPGLLSFREAPVILAVLSRLDCLPDVLVFDGQGYAHPRRMGIATHVGILLDHPTVGCAKSRLCGTHEEPGLESGCYSHLHDKDEVIGAVVRTRTRAKPVFVSTGHRTHLKDAIDLILACGAGFRLPEPTRRAHHLASTEA